MVQEVWLFIGTSRYWLLDAFFKAGDEIITMDDLYGGTYRMFTQIYKHSGIVFHYVDMNNLDNVTAVLNEKQNDLGRNTY
jgi:O-acetylhomoserine/O-acetylserine sulfhydrylase-like pyridoxal-dependent enzyme